MLTSKLLSLFKPDPNQPRKHFDEAALRAFGESLMERQNDPLQPRLCGTIIEASNDGVRPIWSDWKRST